MCFLQVITRFFMSFEISMSIVMSFANLIVLNNKMFNCFHVLFHMLLLSNSEMKAS